MVFVLIAAFYIWTAATTYPLEITGSQANPYNQLATAFLHFHLSLGRAPAAVLNLPDPYEPSQNTPYAQFGPVQTDTLASIHDYVLYHGRLYLIWGPAPALLLMPLQLLGLEPSTSLVACTFAVIGLGFVLATLRVLLRRISEPALWLVILTALTLGLASAVPFTLRRPLVYEEAVSGGFCFAMAGIWMAMSMIANRRASLLRIAVMSLCFGLAVSSRPPLIMVALLLVPVYMSLRAGRKRGSLLVALVGPLGACALLLLAYNEARYGNPFEVGAKFQLAGYDARDVRFGELSNLAPSLWFYLMAPPRLSVLFPFIDLGPPPLTYPLTLPADYALPSATGGLLPMTPILLFLPMLPWVWRRRPAMLGATAAPLLALTVAGVGALVFLSYEFFSTTERYEVDFSTLFLLGATVTWLVLSRGARGRARVLLLAGGALLAVWSCVTGLAISFVGDYNLLAVNHPSIWRKLEDVGSPVSTGIALVSGRPILANVSTPNLALPKYGLATLGVEGASFWMSRSQEATLTIVSPSRRRSVLIAYMKHGAALASGASYGVEVVGPGRAGYAQTLPASGGAVRLGVQLQKGINYVVLRPLATAITNTATTLDPELLLDVKHVSLAGSG